MPCWLIESFSSSSWPWAKWVRGCSGLGTTSLIGTLEFAFGTSLSDVVSLADGCFLISAPSPFPNAFFAIGGDDKRNTANYAKPILEDF